MGCKVDCHFDEACRIAEISGKGFELSRDLYEFRVEPLLLGSEHVEWDCVVVVRFEELVLFALDVELLRGKCFGLYCGIVLEQLELCRERCAKPFRISRLEREPIIELLNEVFHVLNVD